MTTRKWVRICSIRELEPGRGVAALVDGDQVAVFLLQPEAGEPAARLRAIDNRDPVSGANVLSRGLLGSSEGVHYVASPMHKHRFDLESGRCLDGVSPGVRVWPIRVWGTSVEVLAVSHVAGTAPVEAGPLSVATHCPFCALQCGMRLRPDADSVEVDPDPTFPVNEGRMCVKGWASAGLLRNPARLRQPLVRDASGELKPATWEAALDEIAERISVLQAAHGRQTVGVFGSGALTNEKAYLLGKFARVALGTPNIDYNGRFCMSSAAAAQNRSFGIDRGLPFPLADIADTKTLVLWGANPADTMPPLMHWVERMRAAGGQLVVVDPRRSATAEVADLHIQPVPGTDLALALGLLGRADQQGLVDRAYLSARTTGGPDALTSVSGWDPGRVGAVSGVGEALQQRLLDALASPPSSMLLTGRGPEQQSKGVDTVTALINLMLALGRVGRPASGYGCLTGQANGQGGREHGQKADQLPGYRSISDPVDRAAVAAIWGIPPENLPVAGRSAMEMLDGIGEVGGIRALLVFGSNLTVAAPNAGRLRRRIKDLELLVVADSIMSEAAQLAHVVLPVTQWAEEDGTTTNLEGRVIRRRRATDPPAGVCSDIEVMAGLAARLGAGDKFEFESPEAVFDELRRASAGGRADYGGITYGRIDEERGVFWPCPSGDHPGSPRLFEDRFAHPDGRARLVPVDYREAAEPPDREYPLYLTTGRYREHYNSGAQTRLLDRLVRARPAPRLQLHPSQAADLGIQPGSPVRVESRRGAATFEADITEDIRSDTVFAPFHWGGEKSANLLTIGDLDPISKMPEFKVCAVRVRPAGPEDD